MAPTQIAILCTKISISIIISTIKCGNVVRRNVLYLSAADVRAKHSQVTFVLHPFPSPNMSPNIYVNFVVFLVLSNKVLPK